VERLPGNKTSLIHTQQPHRITNIGRSTHPPHRRPATGVPGLDGLDQAPLCATSLDWRQGPAGSVDVRVIMHGNVDAVLRQCEGDAAPNPVNCP
jgi:hypothetical protein